MKICKPIKWGDWALIAILTFAGAPAYADVRLPKVFSDHMVLQEEMAIPVWGWADPGETVEVSLGSEKVKATAASDGKWNLKLPARKASAEPLVLHVQAKNIIEFQDVLIGEVWVCSGQSNMAFQLGGAETAGVELPNADRPLIRLFSVSSKSSLEPIDDVTGAWATCNPTTAKQFSAVGYFFARDISKALNVPVGMIHASMSGSPGQAWMSLEALESEPQLAAYVQDIKSLRENYAAAKSKCDEELAAYEAKLKEWNEQVGVPYNQALNTWSSEVKKAKAGGSPEPPRPVLPSPKPVKPANPEGSTGSPTVLYNAQIAPLMPFAIRGVIWYQGESNGGKEYRAMFPRLISSWREKWGQGNFPFLFVQVAPYGNTKPEIREAQLLTWQKVPNTAMVVTTDVGDPKDIHPKNKEPVGVRLALAALDVAYGKPGESSGPVYEGVTFDQGTATVRFAHIGSGLMARGGDLKGFTLAGADKKFVPATATIQGHQVLVRAEGVDVPTAVRFGWANVPETNLYNQEGLPASPFRSNVE